MRFVPFLLAALVVGTLAQPADAARVRVHHHSGSSPDPVKVDIPDLPAIDYKGLLNADALTVAISKTQLLPAPNAGAKPLANLLKGSHLKKLGEEGGFFKVATAGGKEGYVIKYSVARGKIALKADVAGVVTMTTAATAYSFPNKKVGKPVGEVKAGQKLPHVITMGGFHKIKLPSGKFGYVEAATGTVNK